MAGIRKYFGAPKKRKVLENEKADDVATGGECDTVTVIHDEASGMGIAGLEVTEPAHSSGDRPIADLGLEHGNVAKKSKTAERNASQLKFNPEWKRENTWIQEVENGMLCSPRAQAYGGDAGTINKCHGSWITVPMSNWKKAKEKIKSHRNSALHRDAVALWEAKKQAEKQGSVMQLASRGESKQREENRLFMKKLFRVVYFLAKQRIAHFTNFESLVELVAACGDVQLQNHMEFAAKNATYMSNQMIGEYVQAIGAWLEASILASLKDCQFFCVLADETTDVAVIEELSVCARWLDIEGHIIEAFLDVRQLQACGAADIYQSLIDYFTEKDIPLTKIMAQGYDGCATMSGHKTGVQARMRRHAPRALTHCRAHILQLCCLKAANSVTNMKRLFSTLMAIWKTFHFSPKKCAQLKEIQKVLDLPQLKMIKPSDTRWLAHEKTVSAVRKSLPALKATFEHIHTATGEPEALGIATIIGSFKFVAPLYLLSDVLPVGAGFSRALQSKSTDMQLVKSQLKYTLQSLESIRDDPGSTEYFSKIDDVITAMNMTVTPVEKEQFMVRVAMPYLDTLIESIGRRFEDSLGIITAFDVLDPTNLPDKVQDLREYGNESMEELIGFYGFTTKFSYLETGEEFEASPDIDPDDTRSEWKAFKVTMWDQYREKTFKEMMAHIFASEAKKTTFVNIVRLLSICAVFPVSTATVERSFSDMKIIKNRLRNRLSECNLKHLMKIAIEGPKLEEVNFDEVLDLWRSLGPRRIIL